VNAAACPVCGHAGDAPVMTAREMMFGRGGSYRYRACPDCGTWSLLDVPADLSAHYPQDYYSFGAGVRPYPWWDRFLRRRRAAAWFGAPCPLGRLLLARRGPTPRLRWFRRMGLDRSASVLDVGCGAGEILRELQADGFRNLAGADPYLDADVDHGGGLVLRKAGLDELSGAHDLVMLHHALEHMPEPQAVLARLAALVRPGGWLLLRIPLADSEACARYGADWVQLDAPRHLHLFARDAVRRLGAAHGFRLEHVEDDATPFQFWGSEQYRRGIPLRDPRSHAVAAGGLFTAAELRGWVEETARLNAAGRGDQAAFFLRRI